VTDPAKGFIKEDKISLEAKIKLKNERYLIIQS
jgi:hypothetical protein